MPDPNADEPSSKDGQEYQAIVFHESPEIEALPAGARDALWNMQKMLQGYSRVPIFALIGPSGETLGKAAHALCNAGRGSYIRLSEDIRKIIASNQNFRMEWIDAGYLAQRVLDLANTCSASFLVVDDWEAILGIVRYTNPKAPLEILEMLIYRSPQKPVVLILPIGRGGFGSITEVRNVLEAGGRSRVIALTDENLG
jgi:hypothetical protein